MLVVNLQMDRTKSTTAGTSKGTTAASKGKIIRTETSTENPLRQVFRDKHKEKRYVNINYLIHCPISIQKWYLNSMKTLGAKIRVLKKEEPKLEEDGYLTIHSPSILFLITHSTLKMMTSVVIRD